VFFCRIHDTMSQLERFKATIDRGPHD
jgi:hypothetical protein